MGSCLHLLLLTTLLLPSTFAAVPIIFDTDMDFDVDDVGALCLIHALQVPPLPLLPQDLGEAELVAVVHNVGYPTAIGAVSVINHYYGRDEVTWQFLGASCHPGGPRRIQGPVRGGCGGSLKPNKP